MSRINITREPQSIVVEVEGTFNREVAASLATELAALDDLPVVIDFSRVRVFADVAVPLVVKALRHRPCRLRGLAHHPARVFGYFGVAVDPVLSGEQNADAA